MAGTNPSGAKILEYVAVDYQVVGVGELFTQVSCQAVERVPSEKGAPAHVSAAHSSQKRSEVVFRASPVTFGRT